MSHGSGSEGLNRRQAIGLLDLGAGFTTSSVSRRTMYILLFDPSPSYRYPNPSFSSRRSPPSFP
jgi:hypothetical protein